MTTEKWIDLNDIQAVAIAQSEGWEIEFANSGSQFFAKWSGLAWHADRQFRARPRQPKMKKVKLLAYLGPTNINLVREDAYDDVRYYEEAPRWIRQPKLDLEAEVPDEQ